MMNAPQFRQALSFKIAQDPSLYDVKRLGLIVLKSDETLEAEFQSFFESEQVVIHHSRIASADEVTTDTLSDMAGDMVRAAKLLPNSTDFDVIGYGCTSGATVIGEAKVASLIREVYPNAAVTNPMTALKAKLADLGAKKIGVLTPYVPEVTEAILVELEKAGLEIATIGSFNESREAAVARIPLDVTMNALIDISKQNSCDALFASCTNLPTQGLLEKASEACGVPVISSNSALAWHMSHLAGVNR